MADRSRSTSPASTVVLSRPPTPVPDSRFSSFVAASSTSADDDEDEDGDGASIHPPSTPTAAVTNPSIDALVGGCRLRQQRQHKRARSPSSSSDKDEDEEERRTKRTRVGDSSSSSSSSATNLPEVIDLTNDEESAPGTSSLSSSSISAPNLQEVIDLTHDDEPAPGAATGAEDHRHLEGATTGQDDGNPAPAPAPAPTTAPAPSRRVPLLHYECAICFERVKNITILFCGHVLCRGCLHAALNADALQRIEHDDSLPSNPHLLFMRNLMLLQERR